MTLFNLTLLTICCMVVAVSSRAHLRDASDKRADDVIPPPDNNNNDGQDQSNSDNAAIVSNRAYTINDDEDDKDDEELERRSTANSAEQRVFDLTNQARRVGRYCGWTWYPAVSQVRWNDQLADASRRHAQDMRNQNYFSHDSKDGRSPWTRIKNAGYSCGGAGENIAGNSDADAAVAAWLKSPGHCSNIMGASYKALGVGMASGGPYGAYWVQGFGQC